jgi:4-hydroxy-tetrahydrodipicolinate reductase
MGHEVESFLATRGHSVSYRIDPSGKGNAPSLTEKHLFESDAAIEFSLPEVVMENARLYAVTGTPAVVGTTGWHDRIDEVEAIIMAGGGSFLHGSNFALGAHIFYRLCSRLTSLTDPFSEYDLLMTEFHHKMKKDSPSGTALSAAARVLESSSRKKSVVTERLDRAIEPEELHVSSVRGGYFPGTHMFFADGPADTIEIRHTSRSRAGLAAGSVHAAEWLVGRKGFFTVDDFIEDKFSGIAGKE